MEQHEGMGQSLVDLRVALVAMRHGRPTPLHVCTQEEVVRHQKKVIRLGLDPLRVPRLEPRVGSTPLAGRRR